MNQIKAGAVLSYLSLFLTNVIGLLYTPFMLRMMGQSEYGLYSIIASVISYLTILDFGFGNAIIRYTAKYRTEGKHEEQESLFGMFISLYSFIAILTLFIGSFLYFNIDLIFGGSMTESEIGKAKIMTILMIFNVAVTFPLSIFGAIITAYENFIFQKVVAIIRIILNPAVMIIMLMYGYKAIGMVVITTIFNILTLLINWVYCKRTLKIKISYTKFNWSLLKEIAHYSFYVFLGIIMDRIYWSTGQFVVGIFVGTAAAAVFAIAMQMKTYYMSFSNAISGLFLPKITAMISNSIPDKEISDLFIRTGRIQFLIMGFVMTGFVVYGRPFINLWAGSDYDEAYLISLILMVPLTIPLIQNLGLSILQARNQQKFRSVLFILIASTSLGASIILAKLYGGVGSAIGTSAALVIGQGVVMNIYYHKRINLNIIQFWKEIGGQALPMIIVMVIGIAANYYLNTRSITILTLSAIAYCSIFISTIWKFSMNKYEKDIILSITSKISSKILKRK